MSHPRILAAAWCALACIAALPATAPAAAAPSVDGPSDAVAGGQPRFLWTVGAGGERVTQLALARARAVNEHGALSTTRNARRIGDLGSVTAASVDEPLHAGRWFWNAAWSNAAGDATGWTDVRSFRVPTILRNLRGTYVQHTGTNRFDARGSFMGNPLVARVTCTIQHGRTRVSRRASVVRPRTSKRTTFRCPTLRVPERLDGRPMALRVQVVGGGRRLLAVERFRAT